MSHRNPEHSVVAIYEWLTGVEAAVRALQEAGLDPSRLSVVGHDAGAEKKVGWGARGAVWGRLGGILLGSALFVIPVLGPIFVAGPLVKWIARAFEAAAAGSATGVLAGALASHGIPAGSVAKYEREVRAGKFLVLARGGGDVVAALGGTSPSQLAAHAV